MKIHDIDMDMPDHRSAVKFRGQDKPGFLLSAEKAAGDAQNFREAAALLAAVPGDRARNVAEWLNDLASKYAGVSEAPEMGEGTKQLQERGN
jgi:hypothetical protein